MRGVASSPGDHGNNFSSRDTRPSGESALPSVQYQSDAPRSQLRKRKSYFDSNRGSKRTFLEVADPTEFERGSRSRQCSGLLRQPAGGSLCSQ